MQENLGDSCDGYFFFCLVRFKDLKQMNLFFRYQYLSWAVMLYVVVFGIFKFLVKKWKGHRAGPWSPDC